MLLTSSSQVDSLRGKMASNPPGVRAFGLTHWEPSLSTAPSSQSPLTHSLTHSLTALTRDTRKSHLTIFYTSPPLSTRLIYLAWTYASANRLVPWCTCLINDSCGWITMPYTTTRNAKWEMLQRQANRQLGKSVLPVASYLCLYQWEVNNKNESLIDSQVPKLL